MKKKIISIVQKKVEPWGKAKKIYIQERNPQEVTKTYQVPNQKDLVEMCMLSATKPLLARNRLWKTTAPWAELDVNFSKIWTVNYLVGWGAEMQEEMMEKEKNSSPSSSTKEILPTSNKRKKVEEGAQASSALTTEIISTSSLVEETGAAIVNVQDNGSVDTLMHTLQDAQNQLSQASALNIYGNLYFIVSVEVQEDCMNLALKLKKL